MFYTEAKLSTKDRDKLKDSDFGVPALRKYPLTDANHVRSAIRYFDKCPEKYKPILAKRIKAAAKKFGVELNDKRILAYTEAAVYQEAPGDNTNNQNNRRNQNNQQQNEPATTAEDDDPDPEDYSADTGVDVDTPDATEDGTPDYTTEEEPDEEPAEPAPANAPTDTGATADTQPADTTAAPATTDTAPADTTNPGAATIDTGANTTNTDVNSGADTPDTAGDAGTDTTTGGGDVGTDTDEPTDYTGDNIGASGDDPAAAGDDATGDDMGGEDGTEGEGDDTTADDGTADDGTADAAAGGDTSGVDSDIQQLQQDVFSNLTDAQLALRVNNVKESFIELYNSITNTAQRLVDVKRSSENISTINFLNDQLNSLKGMVRDALTDSFNTKSLAENEMVLQKFISIYALILKIVERISKKEKNENKDENKEDSSFTDED